MKSCRSSGDRGSVCKLDGGENLHEGDRLCMGLGEQESMSRGEREREEHSRLREQEQLAQRSEKCLAYLENVKRSGWTDRDSKKASVKEVTFATWTFSSSSETIFVVELGGNE